MAEVLRTLRSYAKLFLVLGCYGYAFFALAKFGFWCVETRGVNSKSKTVLKLIEEGQLGEWMESCWKALLNDFSLLVAFAVQHSLMAQKRITSSLYWDYVHSKWNIDKAVYNLMTGVLLTIMMHYWEPVGINLWNIELSRNLVLCYYSVHIFAWGAMFGMNAMVDLPNLAGVDQVVINRPTVVPKSPDLKSMIVTQRHLGLIPLSIILLIHPCMSLDRALLLFANYVYIYVSCNSRHCFGYASSMRGAKLSSKLHKPRNLTQSFG